MVYEPQEDSALLAKHVASLARGSVLDMGTGSGVQAITAANSPNVKKVLAVDVDPQAVAQAKRSNPHKKITYRVSDLFSKVRGTFDTIIFNPPYLPAEQGLDDKALVGGRRGYELFCSFLPKALDHLNPEGCIIATYSSLTRPERIAECARNLSLDLAELERMHVFFEDLFVMRFSRSPARSEIEKDGFKRLRFFDRGKRGMIFTAAFRGKKIAVKIKNPSSTAVASIEYEAAMLKAVNKRGIGPNFVKAAGLYVAYEFVEGEFILDFIERSKRTAIVKVLRAVLDQCRALDKMGIAKMEMTRPVKHILITKSRKPVMIDFERARRIPRVHNVSQFCQFLASGRVRFVLASKMIFVDPDQMIILARKYIRSPNDDTFKSVSDSLH